MSDVVIKVENLSKLYRLGVWGSGTLKDDLKRRIARWRGKDDPTTTIGSTNQLDEIDGNEVWALKDINFEVKRGEVLGIIGRNGAGKSTLLKILSEITGPSTGSIRLKGRVASLLEVGTGMHPELTGKENIFLNGALLGMKSHEIKSKYDEIVEFAGVAKYLDTAIKRYSSGMRVRLGFAIAAFLEPEILIVDEVLAVGDADFQKKAIGKMQDVSSREGRTVLFVSHNMASIMNLCNSGILLSRGQVAACGNSTDVVSMYMQGQDNWKNLNVTDSKKKIGQPYFALQDFYIENTRQNNHIYDVNDNVKLKVVIKVNMLLIDIRLNIGLMLVNEFGENVIITYSTDMPTSEWINYELGALTLETEIDTSYLNQGNYVIYLLSSIHCVEMLVTEEDNVKINFSLIGNRGNSPYWFNRRNSVLAPYIEWKRKSI